VPVTTVVVTSCTQRKSGRGGANLAHLPPTSTVERLADAWRQLISSTVPMGTAQSLYQGRSISDTVATAACLGVPWYVVSAGLGLVASDRMVPMYECTVAAGSALSGRLKLAGATTTDWWRTINIQQPLPLSRLIMQFRTLLALPSSYLRMIHDDLAQVSDEKAQQLRIFTSRSGAQFVPRHLTDCVMPYDDRLESIPRYAGTQSDFAQRALRHFVEALRAAPLSLNESRTAVSAALAHRARRFRTAGTRVTDEELRGVLREQWTRHAGSSTRLLRYLRDEAGICCEQKRFSRIWQAMAAEAQVNTQAHQ